MKTHQFFYLFIIRSQKSVEKRIKVFFLLVNENNILTHNKLSDHPDPTIRL